MAASFVAQDGSLTDQHPVHGCRFFNPADEQLAQLIVRVWPWFHSKRLNGVTVLDYGQAMGLCLEFNRDMAADVKARSILLSYARPTALVRVLKIMVTACKLQAQGPMNQASATVLLLKSAAAMSPQHKLDSALQDADLIDKPDPGGNLSPFQRAFTWGLMQEAGAGTPGIAWLLRFDDLTRAARDVPTLEALRIRAIEMGRIDKWVPPPQPNPAAAAAPAAAAPAAAAPAAQPEAPQDPRNNAQMAYEVATLIAENPYMQCASLRCCATTDVAIAAALRSEIHGIGRVPNGNTPEMQKRMRSALPTLSPTSHNILGGGAMQTSQELIGIQRIALPILEPAHLKAEFLYTVLGLLTLQRGLEQHHAWSEFDSTLALSSEERLAAFEQKVEREHNASGNQTLPSDKTQRDGLGNGTSDSQKAKHILAAASKGQCDKENSAAVFDEVARGAVKTGAKSHWAQEMLLRAVSELAPDRKPTAVTQCCALGLFDATIVNQNLHMVNVWATDETLGKYFARCMIDCYKRNSWMTEEQATECANLSLSKLVKKTKTKNWRGDNMPHMITDVIWVIDAHLADKRSQAPQKNARQYGYADTMACARVPVLIGCYMEAIGMQKSGEGSLRDLFVETQACVTGQSSLPAEAQADLCIAKDKLWREVTAEAGDHIHAAWGSPTYSQPLPERNIYTSDDEGAKFEWRNAVKKVLEVNKFADVVSKMVNASAAHQSSTASQADVMEIVRARQGTTKKHKADFNDDGGDDPKKPRKQRKKDEEKLKAEAEARAKQQREQSSNTLAEYRKAGKGNMTGGASKQFYELGKSKWNATEIRKAHPGKCVPALCGKTIGAEFEMQCCPCGPPEHTPGCEAHTPVTGATPVSAFNVKKLEKSTKGAATPNKAKPAKGKGRGDGRGKGGGRGRGRGRGGK